MANDNTSGRMRFVEIGDGRDAIYVRPEAVEVVGQYGDHVKIHTKGCHVITVARPDTASRVRETIERQWDEIERQAGGGEVGTPAMPAPPPVEPDAPIDPAARLAAGERLRFVRDAGPLGEALPAEIDAALIRLGPDIYVVGFNRPGAAIEKQAPQPLCSDWNLVPKTTAICAVASLGRLGYRFAGTADGEGDATP